MHGGEVFEAATSFSLGKLPINKQVIERMQIFPDYRTLGTARNVAQEYQWCNTCTIPIFHALLGQHSLMYQVFDNQEKSAFAQLLVCLLAISLVEMT